MVVWLFRALAADGSHHENNGGDDMVNSNGNKSNTSHSSTCIDGNNICRDSCLLFSCSCCAACRLRPQDWAWGLRSSIRNFLNDLVFNVHYKCVAEFFVVVIDARGYKGSPLET